MILNDENDIIHEVNSRIRFNNVLLIILITVVIASAILGFSIAAKLNVAPSDVLAEVKQSNLINSVIESKHMAIVGLGTDGKINLWSQGAADFFGVTKPNALGFGVAFLIPVKMRNQHQTMFSKALKSSKKSYQQLIKCSALHSDGTKIPVQIHVWVNPGEGAIALFSKQSDIKEVNLND